MASINTRGVLVGGLLAGLVINVGEYLLNVPVLGAQLEAAMAKLGLPPVGGQAIAVFTIMAFIWGILLVWLYAAIRPRFGPGPKTALIAGAFTWAIGYLFPSIGYVVMGMMPANLILIGVIWGFAELSLAALAGARVYTEH